MTTPALLDTQDAERLAKLLGMIGSHHDGEALAAARKAHRCLHQLGLTWRDVIRVSSAVPPPSPHDWRAMAKHCREQAHRLSPKEFDFIFNMAMARHEPSEKQLQWLADIFQRVQP